MTEIKHEGHKTTPAADSLGSSVFANARDETLHLVRALVEVGKIEPHDVPVIIKEIYAALTSLDQKPEKPLRPAVSVEESITPDGIVCLEDGKVFKILRRHLREAYGMTPEQYRAKWGLPPDYPMVAPSYAEMRRNMAHRIGLGKEATSRRRRASASAD